MTAGAVIQAKRPDPGALARHFNVPTEARDMAASLLTYAQEISRAQGISAPLASLTAAESAAGRLEACARAMRTNLRRQIAAAKS